MFKKISVSVFVLACATMMMSNNKGVQILSGFSGVPGESSCTNCHNGGTGFGLKLQSSNIDVKFNGATPTIFKSDSSYLVSIQLKVKAGKKYGFQATIENNNTTNRVGTFTSGSNTLIKSSTYVNYNTMSTTGAFSFNWKAPDSLTYSDTARFYIAVLEGNGNGSNQGDSVLLLNFAIPCTNMPKKINTGICGPECKDQTSVYVDNERVSIVSNTIIPFEIYNQDGRKILAGKSDKEIDMSAFARGIYYLYADKKVNRIIKD
jgi:hypothetical protein